MKALTVLTRAKELIDAGRWLKGGFHLKERRINVKTGKRANKGASVTCYCASGAIRAAGKQRGGNYGPAEEIFLQVLDKKGCGSEAIWDWNDAKERTVGEVRAAFRKAVRLAKAQGA